MNRITSLFGIQYPIIQGGMVWCSGWRLASAVSNAGGLGLLGAGSMHPETLREHIRKCRAATDRPFGVNIPLMYPQIEEIMAIVAEEGVKIVFTSAGNPKAWTGWLHERGIIVAHVVSSSRFAMKCEEAGGDAGVAEGGNYHFLLDSCGTQCDHFAFDRCRRYRYGRRYLCCHGAGSRRGTNRYSLCVDG